MTVSDRSQLSSPGPCARDRRLRHPWHRHSLRRGLALFALALFAIAPLPFATQHAFAQTLQPGDSVTVSIGPELPPLYFNDANGQPSGFVPDLLREIAQRANVSLSFEHVPDLATLRSLDPEEHPLVAWLLAEEHPEGYAEFERSFLTLHAAAFRRRSGLIQEDFRASQLGEVIVVRDSEVERDLLNNDWDSLHPVPTTSEAFQLLASGQFDTVLASEFPSLYTIKSLKLDSVIRSVNSTEMHMHQHLQLLRTRYRVDIERSFAPALAAMRDDGSYDALYAQWFGEYEPRSVPLQTYQWTVGAVLAAFVVLGLVFVLAQKRVRRLLLWQGRTIAANELQIDELVQSVNAIIWEASLDAQFTYVSPHAEALLGYPLNDWYGKDFFADVLLHPDDRNEAVEACYVSSMRGEDHVLDYRARTASGNVLWLHDVVRVVKDADGNPIKLSGVMIDVSEKKNAELKMARSEARLAATIAASPTGIVRLDAQGRVRFANEEASRITGISAGSVDLNRWRDAIHPEDRNAVVESWGRLAEDPKFDTREYRFLHPDGTIVWVLDRGHPETDADGRFEGYVATLTDITPLKKAQELIETNSHVLSSLSEAVIFTDETGTVLYTNKAFDELFGYPAGSPMGRKIDTLGHVSPEELERLVAEVAAGIQKDGSWTGEIHNRRTDGTEFWSRAHIFAIPQENRTLTVCVQEDITDRRKADLALRESEERFRRVAENAGVGIALTDGGKFLFTNDNWNEQWGYSTADLNGLGREAIVKLLVPDEMQSGMLSALARLDVEEFVDEPLHFNDLRIRRKDGAERWVDLTATRLFPDKPTPRMFIAIDTTERKRSESVRTELLDILQRSLNEIYVIDAETHQFTYVNSGALQNLGYTLDEMRQMSPLDISATRTEESLRELFRSLSHGEKEVVQFESIHCRKNGTRYPVEIHLQYMDRDEGGVFLGIVQDITQRKQQQQELQDERNLSNAVFDNAGALMVVLDREGRICRFNRAAEQLSGYTFEEIRGKFPWETFLPPDEADAVRKEAFEGLARDGNKLTGQYKNHWQSKSGQRFLTEWYNTVLLDAQGKMEFMVSVGVDTTDRVRAEHALRESEERFRHVAESALVGIAIFDGERFVFSNNTMIELSGYSPGDLEGFGREDIAKLFLPDAHHADVYRQLKRLDEERFTDQPAVFNDLRIRRKDGTERWVNLTVSRLFPDAPFPRLFLCADITDRVRAEATLRTRSQVLMNMAEGVCFTNADGIILETNPAYDEMFGYERGELIGKHTTVLSDMTKAEVEAFRVDILQAFEEHGEWSGVFKDKTKDGRRVWAKARLTATEIDGKPGIVAVQEDITEARRAEEALRESEEKFRRIAEFSSVGIAVYTGQGFSYLNEAMERISGYGAEDLVSMDRVEMANTFFLEEDIPGIVKKLSELDGPGVCTRSQVLEDIAFRRKDGSIRFVTLAFGRMFPEEPMPRLSICIDNTARKNAEDKLREREALLRRTERLAHVGGWELDIATNTLTWSPQMFEIYELESRVAPSLKEVFASYSSDVKKQMFATRDAAIRERTPQYLEYEMTTAKGTKKWLSGSMEAVFDGDEPVRLSGAVHDLTEMRRAELALRESEARLRAVVESEPECVKLVDDKCHLLEMNPAGLSLIEAESIDAVRGVSTLELLAPEYQELFESGVRDVFQGKSTLQEFEIIGLKGTRRWMEQHAVPLWDSEDPGKVKHMLAVTRDVTQRKRAEAALKESEALFRAITEQMPDAVFLLDFSDPARPGRIVYANESSARMHGMTVDELMGMSITELDDPATAELVPERAQRMMRGETIRFEGLHRKKDGTVFPVDVVARKIEALGSGIVLAIDRDLTEKKRLEDERQAIEHQMQQAQKLESLGVLAGGIAHDFNNLLVGILGNADLARDDLPEGSRARESVAQIEVAARRAAELTHQMLAYSGKGKFVVRRIHVPGVVREMTKLLEVSLSKRAVLRFELDDDIAPIEGDSAQIQQVIMNLITNASDALGDQAGVITIRSREEMFSADDLAPYSIGEPLAPGRYVALEVSDTGCGMDAETVQRIFDPFFTTKFTGRGLGLASVLGIVRAHHGGLRVDSRPGAGTAFTMVIPAAEKIAETASSTNGHDTPAAYDTGGLILVVDDEPHVVELITRAMKRFGFDILKAADGPAALLAFHQHADAIRAAFIDITMPEMSGDEVLSRIRRMRPGVPALLISGFAPSTQSLTTPETDITQFLQKPFAIHDLRECIHSLLRAAERTVHSQSTSD